MITVIADDITGAAEIAGVCLRYGLKVTFGINSVPKGVTDVCVIATDSRSATESQAYHLFQELTESVLTHSGSFLFKKCDSALRGFVLTELTAMQEVTKLKRVLLQPANPHSARCIKNGIYYIGKEKIENTDFVFDPDFPATDSRVEKLLLLRSPIHNQIPEIHTGKLSELNGEGIFVPDCSTLEELKASSELVDQDTLLCGSAAFFEQVMLQKDIVSKLKEQPKTSMSWDFLLVSGSTHSANRHVAGKIPGQNSQVQAFPESMLHLEMKKSIMNAWAEELESIWNKKNRLTLTICENKVSFPGSSSILKQRMGFVVQKLIENCAIKELWIEGGATAFSILNLLNWKNLIPVEELSPGVVRMDIVGFPSIHLTIKPGSYPWPESILTIID